MLPPDSVGNGSFFESIREIHVILYHSQVDIGKREVVGFGYNGEESYIDDVMFPFPAIRFKEDTAEISVRNPLAPSIIQDNTILR